MSQEYEPREGPCRGWRRWFFVVVTLALMSPWLFYAWVAVRSAKEMRVRLSLERNQTTAHLSSRLLEEQAKGALLTLRFFTGRCGVASALRQSDSKTVQHDLNTLVEQIPDLLFMAAYRPDGQRAASYPHSSPACPENARQTRWFATAALRRAPFISGIVQPSDAQSAEAFELVLPLDNGSRRCGYLLAHYRLLRMQSWLEKVRFGPGGAVYIVTDAGQIVTAAGDPPDIPVSLENYPPLRRALQERDEGAIETQLPDKPGAALVGYAPVPTARWVVLVIQPLNTALSPTNYLVKRLSLAVIPIMLLMLAAAWMLDGLYLRQQRMAALLVEQNRRLQAADQAKSDFLANVSHDLRTPLTNLKLSLSGLSDGKAEENPEQTRECLQLASEEVDQLTARVRNLLEMARIEANIYGLYKEPCDLTDIAASALERLKPLLCGRSVQADFPAEPMLVECDIAQMETVVINLLENALKYSPPASPLHLRGALQSGEAVFSVQNAGPGVPPGEEEKIFEKFYRSPTTRSVGGTGLGLAICKAILSAHGGVIGVRRPAEGGATFWFRLPTLAVEAEPESSADAEGTRT